MDGPLLPNGGGGGDKGGPQVRQSPALPPRLSRQGFPAAVHHGRMVHRRGGRCCASLHAMVFIICLIIFLTPQPLPVPQSPAQHLAAHKRLIVCMRVCRSLRRGRSPRGRLKALLLALASPPPPHFGEVCIRAAEGGRGVTARLARPPHPPPPTPPTHSLTPFTWVLRHARLHFL